MALNASPFARLDLAKDHGEPTPRKSLKYRFSFRIKSHCLSVDHIFQGMPNGCAGLVVQDLNGVRPFLASIVWPPKNPARTFSGRLQPFEADNCGCRDFRPSVLNCPRGEPVDIVARDGELFGFRPTFDGDAIPRIRDIAIEFAWMQSMDNTPGTPAKAPPSRLARALAFGPDKIFS
jgi:hypothetical protein